MKKIILPAIMIVLSLVMVGCTLTDVPEGAVDVLDTPTIVLGDEATVEPEPTEEAFPTDEPAPEPPDDSAEPVDEDDVDDSDDDDAARAGCEGNNGTIPSYVEALAEDYGVTVEDIMEWFCRGYGLGEIKEAYRLSEESGKSVEEIFAMREQGMGWGDIKKELEAKPGQGCNPHDEDCDKDNPGQGCNPHDEDCDKDNPGQGCNPHDEDCDKPGGGPPKDLDKDNKEDDD
ncbi:MAG: hypothetical protein JXB30_17000 [Anaerolineae bacterium]|nr:hypothetical protein [Anaerolineae bacterium]